MWFAYVMMFVLGLLSTLLIFIVLLQRGRGGGLAGALGGMGGQSAFGTKAGDVFTKITVILAMVWIVLAAGSIPLMRYLAGNRFEPGSATPATITAPALDKAAAKNLGGDEPADNADTAPPVKNDAETKPDAEKVDAKPTDGEAKSETETPAKDEASSKDAPSEEKPAEKADEPKSEDSKTEADDQPKESPEK